MGLVCIRIELDAEGLFTHGDNELPVGAQACPFGRLQVNADEQVIVATSKRSRQVGVLGGIEKLGFINMAAQGMSHSIIAKCTHSAVEHKCVVVELHQILAFRQLQDVNTPDKQTQTDPDWLGNTGNNPDN